MLIVEVVLEVSCGWEPGLMANIAAPVVPVILELVL